jgi:large subunit ribosomal protein L30
VRVFRWREIAKTVFDMHVAVIGIHRRMQTVYMPHSGVAAGKILRVKELVEVQNVRTDEVRTKKQQREERKAPRGYVVMKKFGS